MDPRSNPSSSSAQQKALEMVYAGRIHRKNGYCEIPTAVFIDKIDVDMPGLPPVAFYKPQGEEFAQIRAAQQPYSPLALSLHQSIWIREEELPVLRSFVERMILGSSIGGDPKAPQPQPSGTPQLPLEKRLETLRRSAILVVEDLFHNPSTENITRSVKMVGSFVHVIMKEPQAYQLLSKLSSHDPYTLQHSVGTAVHSIILGRKLGLLSEDELTELGTAGLLHDIGKTKVKREIINKNGPLDELEWEEMRSHAAEGYEIIKDHPGLTERTKRAVLEHHEDKNGTGYPLGKRASDTDVFSRIVGLCDIFNALTTDRSYSKARSPFDAFQFMKEKLSHKIDDDLFKELVLIYGGNID